MGEIRTASGPQRAWALFHDHLDAIRRETGAELLRYPQPTTECDLQYRTLLETRREVNRMLGEIRDGEPGAAVDRAWIAWFEDIVRGSAFATPEIAAEISRLLAGETAS
ncbi:MAG: hypothetical protein R3229_03740 [Alphaproteobacteria bacterium]|nr:hypothetical protein [Alphaproteobacteria bacterium]